MILTNMGATNYIAVGTNIDGNNIFVYFYNKFSCPFVNCHYSW